MRGPDAVLMKTNDSLVDVIRILLLVEAGIAVVMSLEALASILFAGPLAIVTVVLGATAAITMLLVARGVERRSRTARKLALVVQVGIILVAVIDTVLAIIIAQRGLELVPFLTRMVLPGAIFVLLRKDLVRTVFGVRTKSQKKEYKRAKRALKRAPAPLAQERDEVLV